MFYTLGQYMEIILHWRYILIFPIMIFEGPIITVITSFLASLGYFNIFFVYLLALAGDFTGDTIYYYLGRYSRKHHFVGLLNIMGITEKRIQSLESHFEKHSGKTLVLGKLSHGVGQVVLVAAGVAKMPYWKYMWYNMIATIPKSLLFVLIGFYFGRAYDSINKYMNYTAIGMVALALFFLTAYFIMRTVSKSIEETEK